MSERRRRCFRPDLYGHALEERVVFERRIGNRRDSDGRGRFVHFDHNGRCSQRRLYPSRTEQACLGIHDVHPAVRAGLPECRQGRDQRAEFRQRSFPA